MAIPGTIVNTGNLVTPGGDQGLTGTPSWTLSTAAFTVPAVGSTVTVAVANAAWMTVGEVVWVQNANQAGTGAAPFKVQSIAGNSVTLLNISTSGQTLGDMLRSVYDTNGNNIVDQAEMVPDPAIASVISQRTRGYNAIGNPNFEVDQVQVGTQVTSGPTAVIKVPDRWFVGNGLASGGPNFFGQQVAANTVIPGTNFLITSKSLVLQQAAQKTTLAASDQVYAYQNVEGPQLRELINDVHSVSILASTNVVGGLKFALSIRDSPITKSLVKLCTIPAANTPTLIQLPNIPVFPSGNFTTVPGSVGYLFMICVAAGSTNITPANDTWQTGNYVGAVGMDNFYAKPVGSTLTLYFVQHEPGPLCTSLIDKPFSQNLNECLRYYTKSYDYGTKAGTVTGGAVGAIGAAVIAGLHPLTPIRFPVAMAKTPTVTMYSTQSGASNAVYDSSASIDRSIAGVQAVSAGGYFGATVNTPNAAVSIDYWQHTADTGW